MDAIQIRRLKPLLRRYLRNFDDCFGRSDTRSHLPVYVRGQLSDLPRKSVEPMALAAGLAPRTLQEFLSHLQWDERGMVNRLQRLVARDHGSSHAVGVIDETGCPKKGTKTPGVQRQYCGATGKVENCVVTVHLSYAVDAFHCLLTSGLYLPESWSQDRRRCRQAGIPDAVVYRPKWRIALELLDQALANGVSFGFLTFDEHYGSKAEFLRELDRREQCYVAEVPVNFTGWLSPPRLLQQRRRLRVERRASKVAALLRYSAALRDQPWRRFRVKDGEKGPMVWEAKRVRFYPPTEDGDPGWPGHLLVARNVLQPQAVKYFVSNAPWDTRLQSLLLVAFSRWHVERCFEDEKTELGLDHYEGRRYIGLLRHQALTAVTHLFLARVQEQWRGEKPGADGLPITHGRSGARAILVAGIDGRSTTSATDRRDDQLPTTTQCQGSGQPHQANPTPFARLRHSNDETAALPMGRQLAL